MADLLEGNEPLTKKLFDDDPHIIPLPPLDGKNPTFVLIQDKGVTLTLDDGTLFTPEGIIAVNQTNRVTHINAYKKDGYTFISIISKEE